MLRSWRLLTALVIIIAILINFKPANYNLDVKGVEAVGKMVGWPDLHDLDTLTSSSGLPLDQVNGKLVVGYSERKINYVPLERIPMHVRLAFIAVEDSRFYKHEGIDPWGVARAAFANIRSGEYDEGGSTITQQLAKNLFLSNNKTMTRKVEEAYLALQLEKKYSKDEILEMYLNQIYFGSGAYGIDSASKKFFGRSVGKLTLAQGAVLAGIPKNPAGYSPIKKPEVSLKRQGVVLDRMLAMGFITKEEAMAAKKEGFGRTGESRTEASW